MTDNTELTEQEQEKIFQDAFNKAAGVEVEKVEEPAKTPDPEPDLKPEVEEKEQPEPEKKEETQPDPDEWLKELPEDKRNRFIQERNDFKANAQRNAALQRHLNEARAQLEALKKPPEVKQPDPPKLDKWDALNETDKELAQSVEQRIADAVAKATQDLEKKFEAKIVPLEKKDEQAVVDRELYLLTQAVPNFREVINTDHFHNWLDNQSGLTRAKFEDSIDHRDAVDVLRLYASTLTGYAPQSVKQPAPDPAADKIAAEREQRKQASAPPKSNAAGMPKNISDEDLSGKAGDELFEAAFNKALRQN